MMATTFSWWARILFTGLLGLGLAACSNSTPLEAVVSKTCLTGGTTPVETGQTMRINVLSNRADLISGGKCLGGDRAAAGSEGGQPGRGYRRP